MGHPFTIESDEAFELVTELSAMTGWSIDTVVTDALRARLKVEQDQREFVERVRQATAEFRATLTSVPTSSDHGFLYNDETGLPV